MIGYPRVHWWTKNVSECIFPKIMEEYQLLTGELQPSSSQWIPPKKTLEDQSEDSNIHPTSMSFRHYFWWEKNLHPKKINGGWNLQITINHPWKEGKWSEPNIHGIMFHLNLQGCIQMFNLYTQAVEVCADVGDVTIFAANKNAASFAGQSAGTDFKHGVPRISDQVRYPRCATQW